MNRIQARADTRSRRSNRTGNSSTARSILPRNSKDERNKCQALMLFFVRQLAVARQVTLAGLKQQPCREPFLDPRANAYGAGRGIGSTSGLPEVPLGGKAPCRWPIA